MADVGDVRGSVMSNCHFNVICLHSVSIIYAYINEIASGGVIIKMLLSRTTQYFLENFLVETTNSEFSYLERTYTSITG